MGHGENAISGHFDHAAAQKQSLTLSLSLALHVSLLLIQRGLFLTSYLYALVGKDFLDIIPKLPKFPALSNSVLSMSGRIVR